MLFYVIFNLFVTEKEPQNTFDTRLLYTPHSVDHGDTSDTFQLFNLGKEFHVMKYETVRRKKDVLPGKRRQCWPRASQ